MGLRRWFCGSENVATQSRKRSRAFSMIREPVSEDAFAVAEAPMLSSPHGLPVSFLKMLQPHGQTGVNPSRETVEFGTALIILDDWI